MDGVCCAHPRENDLEDELAIAEKARADGDWKHALHHYVSALGMDACSEQAVAAIRRLNAERDLAPHLEKDSYAGAHVARAHLLADRGDVAEAVTITAQVDEAMPQIGAIRLIVDWFDRVPAGSDARGWALRRLTGASQIGIGRLRLLPGERSAVEPYAELAAKIVVHERDPMVLAAASAVLRRAGRWNEAIALFDGVADSPPNALVALALAHRAAGDAEKAAELFERIRTLTGEPIYAIERARALGDAKKWADARALVDQFVAESNKQPDQEIALFREWLEGCIRGDATALARDYDWVRRSALLHGAIVGTGDASTSLLGDPRVKRGDKVKVGVSSLEAPSARMCLAVHQGDGPSPRAVAYSFSDVPTPDPRLPRGNPKTVLWVEREGVMVQAVPSPAEEIRSLVDELTRRSNDLFEAWDAAAELAPRAAGRLEEIVHAMVYPLDPPDGEPTHKWVFRWQVAAACLVARAESGWRGTQRRRLLLDLVRGPVDWTTAAAVHVLGEIAVREPDALPEIRRELTLLGKAIPQGGHCCYGQTLAVVAAKVPFFPPDLRATLARDWFGKAAKAKKRRRRLLLRWRSRSVLGGASGDDQSTSIRSSPRLWRTSDPRCSETTSSPSFTWMRIGTR